MWKAKNPFPHSHSLHGCGILQRQTKTDVYTKDWTLPAARSAELLPVPYFHIVFTLPHELSALILQNKRLLYDLLFRTSAASLLELARDPKHLGADIGFLGVLHTWGQNLQVHPHVHYIVPAGGLAPDGSRWIDSSPRFFLPVKALSWGGPFE